MHLSVVGRQAAVIEKSSIFKASIELERVEHEGSPLPAAAALNFPTFMRDEKVTCAYPE